MPIPTARPPIRCSASMLELQQLINATAAFDYVTCLRNITSPSRNSNSPKPLPRQLRLNMDPLAFIRSTARKSTKPLKTIEMHTCGEPTRIVYDGYPDLQ